LRYAFFDFGVPPLLEAYRWGETIDYILACIRDKDGRRGKARPIEPRRPVKPSIKDRRARRLAQRRMRLIARGG